MILLDVDLIESKYEQYKKDNDYTHLTSIASEIYSCYKSASEQTLKELTVKIDENVNFYRGNHYLYFDNSINRFRPYGRNKYNKDIPQETTNYVGVEVDNIVSLLTRGKEDFLVVPNSNDAEDRNKAKIGEALLEGNYFLNNESYNKLLLVKIGVLCGTSYRKDYYDNSYVGFDKNGNLIEGETVTKILSPLEIIPDYQNGIRDIDDGKYVIEFGFYPVSQIKDEFSINKEGFTNKIESVKEDTSTNIQLDYLQKLKNPDQTLDKNLKNYAIKLETYIKPTKRNKKGIMIISTHNDILYINDNKIYNQFGGRFWSPYSMFRYKRDPFSHYGISLPELIIPLNKAINSIDSLVKLNRQTMVAPKVLVPVGSLSPEQEISGVPGLKIEYRPGLGDIKFEYGKPLDQSVIQERQQKVSDISRISGSNEVLQGIRPAGVSTTSGLNLLLEQAYSQFSNTVKELAICLSKSYTKVLNLKRYCYQEPRQDYINRIKAINNNLTRVAITDFFTGEDLGNNIDVKVEEGSVAPKSLVMEQQNIKEISQMGVFGPLDPLQNPVGNKYFLNKMGLDKFQTPTNNDTTRALWENDLIRNSRFEEVKVMPVDNNIIHYKVLLEEIKKPDFYDNNEESVITAYWKHLCEHYQAMNEIEHQQSEISQYQMQELDIMSVNLGIISQEELTQKIMQRQQMAAIGQQSPNGQVPFPNVPMSNSGIEGNMQNNSSEMM